MNGRWLAMLAVAAVLGSHPVAAETIRVAPGASLASVVAAAPPGAVVRVDGGTWKGPLEIPADVTVVGESRPVLDGGGHGTVVRLRGRGAALRGFVVRGSGSSLADENSGVALEAPQCVVSDCDLQDTLFGIYVDKAAGSRVERNHVTSKDLPMAQRGDAIRVWYSNDVVIKDNTVERSRDAVLWYSSHLEVSGNQVTASRYGLHLMYDDDAHIHDNYLSGNSVGIYLMYSRRLRLVHNTLSGNRGPSGYGLGLKDDDDALVRDNLFADNRVGIWVDNSPRELSSSVAWQGNVVAENDVGVALMPQVQRNRWQANSFVENGEQVQIDGGGDLHDDRWQGNFWSDYSGYDADRDGTGDLPYQARHLFEALLDGHPALRLFEGSPAADALDFAARAVPLVAPHAKLQDDRPQMAAHLPLELPRGPVVATTPALPWRRPLEIGLGLVLSVAGLGALGHRRTITRGGPMRIEHLSKAFGQNKVLDDVSFELKPGEAVALWGSNGAGKTTLMRCILGLLDCRGRLFVGDENLGSGPALRRLVGFVPQELTMHDDLTVRETMLLYARLRKARRDSIDPLLSQLGLDVHRRKSVRQLSGGLKQRLALGIALLGDPPYLMLDEPTSNLDAEARATFLALLQGLRKAGKTLLFTSHRRDEVAALADRVLVLEKGRLIQEVAPAGSSGQAVLHLLLPDHVRDDALRVLADKGLASSRNGRGIYVTVDAREKGEPFELLLSHGIVVTDFDIERNVHGS